MPARPGPRLWRRCRSPVATCALGRKARLACIGAPPRYIRPHRGRLPRPHTTLHLHRRKRPLPSVAIDASVRVERNRQPHRRPRLLNRLGAGRRSILPSHSSLRHRCEVHGHRHLRQR